MADFINYGDLQLEQLALLNNLANNVQNYVNTQPWSNKRKEKFMSAYSDIMNNGVLGASNSTGQWVLNTRNAIDLNSKDRKDREMYQEAAYFIQQQMAGLSSKVASEKEQEEKEKEELPTFNNEYFVNNIKTRVSNLFGGQSDITQAWNELDKREENGLRGTSVRRERLAKVLQDYLDNFDETKVNFENSPFKDVNDFRTRMNTAILALKSGEDATDALNAIGLKRSQWLYDGSGDLYDIDKDGNPITYGQYAESKIKLEQQKALEEALLKLLKANALRGILSLVGGIHAVEARNTPEAYQEYLTRYGTGQAGFNAVNNRVSELINKGYAGQLTGADKKELGNLLYYIRFNNPDYKGLGNGTNTNITDQEWADLRLHTDKLSSVNRGNFVRLPWQTQDGRYTYADNKGNLYFLKPNKGQKFANPIRGKGYYDYKNNFLNQTLLSTKGIHLLSDGLEYEDYARMGAALGDIISLGGFTANVVGSTASLIGDTTADLADESLSWGDRLKNLGSNAMWTAAGFIPGGKLGKVSKNIMRWAPKLMVVLLDYNLLTDKSNQNTWNKLTSDRLTKEGLNSEDLRNITYWVRALTGTANAAKSTFRDIKYSKARGELKQLFTTKDNKKVTLSNDEVKEINRVGARLGQEEAKKLFKTKTGHEIADNEIDFSEKGRSGLFKDTRSRFLDKRLSGKSVIERNAKLLRYFDLYALDRNKGGWFGWRPIWSRGTSSYFDHFDSGSFRNPLNGIGRRLDPYRNEFNQRLDNSSNNSTQIISPQFKGSPNNFPPYVKGLSIERPIELPIIQTRNKTIFNKSYNDVTEKALKSLDDGNFSNNKLKGGTENISGHRLQVVEQTDGTYNLIYKGNILGNYLKSDQRSIQKAIRDIINSRTINIGADKTKKIGAERIGTILLKLKKKGWLKQGGKITDTQIDNFLKQYK